MLPRRQVDPDVARRDHERLDRLTVDRDFPIRVIGLLQDDVRSGGALDDDLDRIDRVALEQGLAAIGAAS